MSLRPEARESRSAVSALIPRLRRTISLFRRGETSTTGSRVKRGNSPRKQAPNAYPVFQVRQSATELAAALTTNAINAAQLSYIANGKYSWASSAMVVHMVEEIRPKNVSDGRNNGSQGVASWAIVATVGIVMLGSSAGTPEAAADNSYCTAVSEYCAFYSPSHRIDCEINTGGYSGPDSVYCKTVEPPQSVHMDNTGVSNTCTGDSCLGNAAEGIPTLAYGQTMTLGPFSCLSEVSGVTCTAAQGRGFVISTSGITTVG